MHAVNHIDAYGLSENLRVLREGDMTFISPYLLENEEINVIYTSASWPIHYTYKFMLLGLGNPSTVHIICNSEHITHLKDFLKTLNNSAYACKSTRIVQGFVESGRELHANERHLQVRNIEAISSPSIDNLRCKSLLGRQY
jgi:hypothetical protein